MANLNAPSGFAPVMYRDGSPWNGAARMYCILAADTNAYYIGDPVKMAAGGADAAGIAAVTRGTAGATVRGVIVAIGLAVQPGSFQGGPYVNPNDLSKTSRPSGAQSQNYYCLVVDDPAVIFEIQEDTTSTPGVAANMVQNANFVYAAPATGIYVSGVQLNSGSYAVTATLNCKVIGVVQRGDNTAFTAYQKLLVTLNNHDFSTGVLAY